MGPSRIFPRVFRKRRTGARADCPKFWENQVLCHVSSIRSTFRHRFRNTSPWFTLTVVRSFFLSYMYIHDGALIHLLVRYDLEPKSTQLSDRLPGNAYYSAGGIVRLTLTERMRFRYMYVRLRALRRKAILQVFTGLRLASLSIVGSRNWICSQCIYIGTPASSK